MKIKFLVSTLFFFLVASVFSLIHSQNVFFETYFGTFSSEVGRSVQQLADGSIYVAGYANAGSKGEFDFALNKSDRYGNLIWTKYYGDSLDNNGLFMNKCADGNFIFVGETQTVSNGLDILIYKIDTAGTVLWTKRYGSPVNESGRYIEQTHDNGYILCGLKNDTAGSNDIYTLKIDSVGNFLWDKMIGGIDNDYSSMIHEVENKQFIVIGDTKSMGAGSYDIEVAKMDSVGNIIWNKSYGDSVNNGSQGILVTSKNKYLAYGESEATPSSPFDCHVELIDTDGSSLWKKKLGEIKSDAAFSAVESKDGGFVFTGYSNSYAPGGLDVLILKTDSLGNLLWTNHYGDIGIDIGYHIIPSMYNGYLIAGTTTRGDGDFYLLHLDTMGTITGIQKEYGRNCNVLFYPNPFNETSLLQISDWEKFKDQKPLLEIFDLLGRKVIRLEINNYEIAVPRHNLKSGIYTYLIEGNEGMIASGKISAE